MNFKNWLKLQEVGTGTDCVAGFQQRVGAMTRRWWVSNWEDELNNKQNRNKKTKFTYKLPQLEEKNYH
jgi:hypothetical protein